MISKDVNNLFFRFFMDISVPFVTTKIFFVTIPDNRGLTVF